LPSYYPRLQSACLYVVSKSHRAHEYGVSFNPHHEYGAVFKTISSKSVKISSKHVKFMVNHQEMWFDQQNYLLEIIIVDSLSKVSNCLYEMIISRKSVIFLTMLVMC
jgi:hypothetical protein